MCAARRRIVREQIALKPGQGGCGRCVRCAGAAGAIGCDAQRLESFAVAGWNGAITDLAAAMTAVRELLLRLSSPIAMSSNRTVLSASSPGWRQLRRRRLEHRRVINGAGLLPLLDRALEQRGQDRRSPGGRSADPARAPAMRSSPACGSARAGSPACRRRAQSIPERLSSADRRPRGRPRLRR